jgi:hypothetical protein
MLSDFMQVLNSARDIYTKNYYFSNSKLFSTISLLQNRDEIMEIIISRK